MLLLVHCRHKKKKAIWNQPHLTIQHTINIGPSFCPSTASTEHDCHLTNNREYIQDWAFLLPFDSINIAELLTFDISDARCMAQANVSNDKEAAGWIGRGAINSLKNPGQEIIQRSK